MAYRCGTDRYQTTFLPPSLDQYISQDHPVRAYDVFVESLNFMELGIELDDRKAQEQKSAEKGSEPLCRDVFETGADRRKHLLG